MHQELEGTAPGALLPGCAQSPPTHRDHNPWLHSTLASLRKNQEHPKGDQRSPRPAVGGDTVPQGSQRKKSVSLTPHLPCSVTSVVIQTQQMVFFSTLPSMGVGKLKISDAFQKAHCMPPCFIRYTFYSDLWGGPPGRGKHNLTPAFRRGLCLFLLKNHFLSLKERARKRADVPCPSQKPIQFLNYTWI